MLTAALVLALVLAHATFTLWRRRADAIQDGLTGLASRDFFERVLRHHTARLARRADFGFAVLMIEVGGNGTLDSLGRFGAQDVIADAAERLANCARPSDVLARVAKRRFAVLLNDVTLPEEACRAAERLLASVGEAATLGGKRVRLAAAAGIAMSDGPAVSPAELMARAEAALDGSKPPTGSPVLWSPDATHQAPGR
jgi:diguanylate cyclase (GGDEF)-like protein